jgi:hypothetical protein
VRDRGTTPALLATDLSSAIFTTLSTAAAANTKPSWAAALALQSFLLARFRNAPDLQLTELPHHWDCGIQVYYYYPRLSVDFGSTFFSPSALDKFDFLAMEITLNTPGQLEGGDRVRFTDFNPKASDFIDYSRGQFTAAAQLQAQLAYLSSKGVSQVTGEAPDTTTTTRNTSVGPSSGPQISGTVSDSYVSQLADSIERRTSTILADGRTFYSDFRSIRQVRIGGTYNFDIQLQVPAHAVRVPCDPKSVTPCQPDAEHCGTGLAGNYASMPVDAHVTADVTLIGMVRHVFRRGRIGSFARVPEAENDDVYEEVVLKRLPRVRLWDFSGDAAIYQVSPRPPRCAIAIATNRDDATFVASDLSGKLLGKGSGKDASISFSADEDGRCKGSLTFMPIVVDRQKGPMEVLGATVLANNGASAAAKHGITLLPFAFDENTPWSVIASYTP